MMMMMMMMMLQNVVPMEELMMMLSGPEMVPTQRFDGRAAWCGWMVSRALEWETVRT